MEKALPLIERFGDDAKQQALEAAKRLQQEDKPKPIAASFAGLPKGEHFAGRELALRSDAAKAQSNVRDDIYKVIAQLKHVNQAQGAGEADKKQAETLSKEIGRSVEYAPWWVRILSALCLGIGTMIGYERIVKTLGERLGRSHLTPAQGASAEVVSAVLISVSGFTGLPVSTTHVVTSGIGGTMVVAGAGLQMPVLRRILLAWLVTLPVTIAIAAGLYYLLES